MLQEVVTVKKALHGSGIRAAVRQVVDIKGRVWLLITVPMRKEDTRPWMPIRDMVANIAQTVSGRVGMYNGLIDVECRVPVR